MRTTSPVCGVCHRLTGGDESATVPQARLLEFASDLVVEYPRLEGLTDLDDSPWNMSPDATDHRVILCIGLSKASIVGPRILELAERCRLVCCDPSTRQVHHPPQTTPVDALRLEAAIGSRIFGPTGDEIEQQVRSLTWVNWHLWLECGEGVYVQIGLGAWAGAPQGRYSLEYREAPAGPHHRTFIDDRDAAAAAFRGFAADDTTWISAHTWTLL